VASSCPSPLEKGWDEVEKENNKLIPNSRYFMILKFLLFNQKNALIFAATRLREPPPAEKQFGQGSCHETGTYKGVTHQAMPQRWLPVTKKKLYLFNERTESL